MTIVYGTHGSESQEEAMERFWAPSVKYANELFAEKAKRVRAFCQVPVRKKGRKKNG